MHSIWFWSHVYASVQQVRYRVYMLPHQKTEAKNTKKHKHQLDLQKPHISFPHIQYADLGKVLHCSTTSWMECSFVILMRARTVVLLDATMPWTWALEPFWSQTESSKNLLLLNSAVQQSNLQFSKIRQNTDSKASHHYTINTNTTCYLTLINRIWCRYLAICLQEEKSKIKHFISIPQMPTQLRAISLRRGMPDPSLAGIYTQISRQFKNIKERLT